MAWLLLHFHLWKIKSQEIIKINEKEERFVQLWERFSSFGEIVEKSISLLLDEWEIHLQISSKWLMLIGHWSLDFFDWKEIKRVRKKEEEIERNFERFMSAMRCDATSEKWTGQIKLCTTQFKIRKNVSIFSPLLLPSPPNDNFNFFDEMIEINTIFQIDDQWTIKMLFLSIAINRENERERNKIVLLLFFEINQRSAVVRRESHLKSS